MIVLVWALVYVGSYVQQRTAPPELSAVMLAAVTWLFGSEVKKVVVRNGGTRRRDSE